MSDLTPETRCLLARGRQGHSLPEGRRKGLKRALLLRIAGGAVVASTTSATALAAKVVAVALLVGALGGGVASVVGSRGRAQALTPLRAATTAAAAEPARDEPAAPVATTPSAAIASPVAIDPGKPPSSATLASAPSPRQAPVLAPVSSALPPPVPSLQAEARLLLEAHHALNEGDPATALRLLGEHAVRFPGSALEPERAAERVLALCAAGRTIDARREARAFVAQHGSGPLALRVQRSCGGGEE